MGLVKLTSQEATGAIAVCSRISELGKQAWLVGGAVRDSLIGKPATDFDIATDAKPDQLMRWFTKVIPTGIKHGTVTILDNNGNKYEVTTFRGEAVYSDGRHPDNVTFAETIEQDLSRRDFTVNAVAYSPITDMVCDPYGGCFDILSKRIRTVGSPDKRFSEDGLRCLRAARFSATLEFSIEEETRVAISRNLNTYKKISVERIVSEWRKAFKARLPSIAFSNMAETGLLGTTIPELIPSYGMAQNRYHAYDIFRHTLEVIDCSPKNELVQLAALFHDVAKAYTRGIHPVTGQTTFYDHEEQGAVMTKDIMTRLKFSTEEIEKVSTLVRHHLLPRNDLSSAALRRWVRRVGAENVDELLDLAQADLEGKGPAEEKIPDDFVLKFRARINEFGAVAPIVSKTNQLAIDGNDVMGVLGIKPGREVGLALDKLLEYVTDSPDMNTRPDLFAYLNQMGYSTQPWPPSIE